MLDHVIVNGVFENHWTFKIIVSADDANRHFERGKRLGFKELSRFRLQRLRASAAKSMLHNCRNYCEVKAFDLFDPVT